MNPRRYLLGLLLVAATIAVYGRAVSFDFVSYDDRAYVVENPHVQAGLTWAGVGWAFRSTEQSNWHPVTWLSLMLDASAGGSSPRLFHATNVLLHAVNTLLLFFLLAALTGRELASAVVAALFAVHPLHVESVAWIAERKDVLSTLFWLLTLLAYRRFVERPGRGRYLLVVGTFAAGLMAKPMLVTLPFVLLLLDYWPLGRANPFRRTAGRLVLEKLPLFALAAASSAVTLVVQSRGDAVTPFAIRPLGARIGNAAVAYVAYAGKMLWPSGLAFFYPLRTLPWGKVVGSSLLLLVITTLALLAAKKRPYLTVGWLWYLVTLLPVIGLVQVGGQAMADRYTYVPLTGLFLALVWGVSDAVRGASAGARRLEAAPARGRGVALAAAALGVIAVLIVCASVQLGHWRDSESLFEHAVAVTADNAVAHNNLGAVLGKAGRYDDAIAHYTEAVRIEPGYQEPWSNLSAALLKRGRLEEGIAVCRETLEHWPDLATAHHDLGLGLMRLADARAGASAPGGVPDLALDERLQGMRNEGIQHLFAAVRRDPALGEARLNLGIALTRQGRLDQAITQFAEALKLRPGDANAVRLLEQARGRRAARP